MEVLSAMRGGRALACPSCAAALVVVVREAVEVDMCAGCKGAWVDHMEEKDLLGIKPEAFTIDELRRLRKLYKPLGVVEKVKYRKCPECTELMYRINWGSHSGVVVDRCEKHGTWFDEKEVEKLREFVKLGGVELEKLRLTESGLAELESKLGNEVTKLQLRIDSAYRRARLFGMVGL